jgi:ParB family chromosome partitioning protein
MKKADLVAALVKHFDNAMSATDPLPSQIKARGWLPEAMSFPAVDPHAIAESLADDEAFGDADTDEIDAECDNE